MGLRPLPADRVGPYVAGAPPCPSFSFSSVKDLGLSEPSSEGWYEPGQSSCWLPSSVRVSHRYHPGISVRLGRCGLLVLKSSFVPSTFYYLLFYCPPYCPMFRSHF